MGRVKRKDEEMAEAAERSEFSESDPPNADLLANEKQEHKGGFEGGEGGTTEAAPQEPTGNPTERGAIKRANFSKIASRRVTRILDGLRTLKHCSNTATYEWTEDQENKIFNAIEESTKEVRKAFEVARRPKVRAADRRQQRFDV